MRRFLPFVGLVLLLSLAACGSHPVARILSPDTALPLTQDEVRAKARNLDGAEGLVAEVESIVRAAYETERLVCLDLVVLSSSGGDRVIRTGAPSWCQEAEAMRLALVESRALVLGQLEAWRAMGEADEMARDQFLLVLWQEYQRTLATVSRLRAISGGAGF